MYLSCPPRRRSKDGPFVAPITGERGEGEELSALWALYLFRREGQERSLLPLLFY